MSLTGTFTPDNLIAGDEKVITEDIFVPTSRSLVRGTVLGRVKVSVPTTGTLAGTGNGTMTLVTGGPKTIQGDYVITCIVLPATHGGTFKVVNPDGKVLGTFTMPDTAGGTFAFSSDEISFTLTDGSTNFDLTSIFTVTVTEGVPNSVVVTGTGNGTLTNLEGRRDLKVGNYVLACVTAVTHGGVFSLTDPDGNVIDDNITIPAGAGNHIDFANDHLVGTITDGSTDFIVGDLFTITITIHPRQCVACGKAATDGSSVPYAVLLEDLDATSVVKVGAAAIKGEFNERQLVFASGTDIEDLRDAMRDVGLYTKGSVAA